MSSFSHSDLDNKMLKDSSVIVTPSIKNLQILLFFSCILDCISLFFFTRKAVIGFSSIINLFLYFFIIQVNVAHEATGGIDINGVTGDSVSIFDVCKLMNGNFWPACNFKTDGFILFDFRIDGDCNLITVNGC
jgi:hypothetical protein